MVSNAWQSKNQPFPRSNSNRLRVHPTQEWHDIYSEACNDELLKFFDHYLKGVENDWESTPEVRISLLKYNQVSKNTKKGNMRTIA